MNKAHYIVHAGMSDSCADTSCSYQSRAPPSENPRSVMSVLHPHCGLCTIHLSASCCANITLYCKHGSTMHNELCFQSWYWLESLLAVTPQKALIKPTNLTVTFKVRGSNLTAVFNWHVPDGPSRRHLTGYQVTLVEVTSTNRLRDDNISHSQILTPVSTWPQAHGLFHNWTFSAPPAPTPKRATGDKLVQVSYTTHDIS